MGHGFGVYFGNNILAESKDSGDDGPGAGIKRLTCGYSSASRERKLLVIMEPEPYQAFCDGSKGTGSDKILLLSALVHTVPTWEKFSNDWDTALKAKPSIKHFHMREARKLEGNFKRWKATDRDLKIIALTEVILRHQPHVVSCWFSSDKFNQTIRPAGTSDLRHAYFLAFQMIIPTVAEYQLKRGITIPADFVFDEEGDIGNEALIWYPAIKAAAEPNVRALMGATPVFRNDEEVLPLQAADLIAWHKRRKKEALSLDFEVAASQRVDELPGAERHIPKEWLVDIAANIAQVPNVALFRDKPSVYKKLKRAYRTGKKEI